jgi:hypothetical protein
MTGILKIINKISVISGSDKMAQTKKGVASNAPTYYSVN